MSTIATITGAQFDAMPNDEGRRCYLDASGISALAYPDVEFALTDNDRVRPEVCVLLGDKAPDIAVEVISPTERSAESHDKVRAYLRKGTAEVWQVYPKSRTVQIHRGEIGRLFESSQQVASDLLPSFALPLSALFG